MHRNIPVHGIQRSDDQLPKRHSLKRCHHVPESKTPSAIAIFPSMRYLCTNPRRPYTNFTGSAGFECSSTHVTLLSLSLSLPFPSPLTFFGLIRTNDTAIASSVPSYWYVGGDAAPPDVWPTPLPSLITSNVCGK